MKRIPILAAALLCGPVFAEPFSAEHLVRLDRVGAPALSPDGAQVAYAVRDTDMEANTGRYDIWLSPLEGGKPRRLTRHEANDTAPAWSPDGQALYFLSARGDTTQVWRIALAGGEATVHVEVVKGVKGATGMDGKVQRHARLLETIEGFGGWERADERLEETDRAAYVDALEVALTAERQAAMYYDAIADAFSGEVRTFFEDLAKCEEEHASRIAKRQAGS